MTSTRKTIEVSYLSTDEKSYRNGAFEFELNSHNFDGMGCILKCSLCNQHVRLSFKLVKKFVNQLSIIVSCNRLNVGVGILRSGSLLASFRK